MTAMVSELRKRLTDEQLVIVMHIANGKTIAEIAKLTHRSESNVNVHLARARRRAHAKNTPHLVSIAIATGDLVWEPEEDCRKLPGTE